MDFELSDELIAVRELAREFDGITLDALEVPRRSHGIDEHAHDAITSRGWRVRGRVGKGELAFARLDLEALLAVVGADALDLHRRPSRRSSISQPVRRAMLSASRRRLRARYPGDVVGVRARRRGGSLVYDVKLISGDGRLIRVRIDAKSGDLMGVIGR